MSATVVKPALCSLDWNVGGRGKLLISLCMLTSVRLYAMLLIFSLNHYCFPQFCREAGDPCAHECDVINSRVVVLVMDSKKADVDNSIFKDFLNEFCTHRDGPLSDQTPLPSRVLSAGVTEAEIEGECLDWLQQFLHTL